MAYVKIKLWSDTTPKVAYDSKLIFLGDISNWSTEPGLVSNGILSGMSGVTIYKIKAVATNVDAGFNIINRNLGRNYHYYITPQDVAGYYVTNNFIDPPTNYGNLAVLNVSNQTSMNLRCNYGTTQHVNKIVPGLAIINGYQIFGVIVTGISNGVNYTAFCSNADMPAVYALATTSGDPYNPYSPGNYSTETPDLPSNFSEDSDVVTVDAMPDESVTSAVGSGFSTIFTPTKAQLKSLADVFWGQTIVGFFQNMVENISSMFVSLGIMPFVVDAGNTVSVKWLGLIDTTINLTLAASQLMEFDMGSINMADDANIFTSGSVLDYSPFSKLGIYLPFIGYQELDIDECRNAVIGLRYRIDILSGSCVAIIRIDGRDIYQFSGNCLTQIPLTSTDMSGLLTSSVQVAVSAASLGANGAVASAGDALTGERFEKGDLSQAGADLQHSQHLASVIGSSGQLVSATVNGMMGMKPNFKKSGAISASNSLLAVKQPFLFLTTPRQSMPEHYERYCGFPCNITGSLGSFSGFTVVEDIRLNGLVATSSEVEEIYQLLKTGIII